MKPYRKAAGVNPDGTKRYSPYWWISFEDASGRRIHETTKTDSLTEAKRMLADRQAAVLSKGLVFENFRKVCLFKELSEDYLAWHREQHSSSKQHSGYRFGHLTAFFGAKDLNKISSEDIAAYRKWRSSKKVGGDRSTRFVSPSTINRELDSFNAAFNWAKGEAKYQNVIRVNPYVRRKHRTKEPAAPTGWFDPDSKSRFLEACEALPSNAKHFPPQLLRAIVEVLWATGMRIEECLSLRKHQVKLDYRLVQLEGWQTKNKKAGDVDLRTDSAFHVFRLACQDKKDTELVFQWHEGDRLRQPGRCKVQREAGQIPYSAIASAFKGACAKAGLLNLTLHSCRKTAATEMAIEGYSVLEIKDMLHHQDLTTTLRYINQTAVNETRRKQRMQLKMSGVIDSLDVPERQAIGESATQLLHKASGQGR